jgi:hypothetical protein
MITKIREWSLERRKDDHLVIAAGPRHVGFDLNVASHGNRRSYYTWESTGNVDNPLKELNEFNSLAEAGMYADRLCTALNKANS